MTLLKELFALTELKNHMGETEYSSYKSWKAAVKKVVGDSPVTFIGDSSMDEAHVKDDNGKMRAVGEWDGYVGVVYKKPAGMKVDESRLRSAKERDAHDLGFKNASKGTPTELKDTCPYTSGTPEYRAYYRGVEDHAMANPKKAKSLKEGRGCPSWFKNGAKVKLRSEYADKDPQEVFTLSNVDDEQGDGKISDDDGKGWTVKHFKVYPANLKTEPVDETLTTAKAESHGGEWLVKFIHCPSATDKRQLSIRSIKAITSGQAVALAKAKLPKELQDCAEVESVKMMSEPVKETLGEDADYAKQLVRGEKAGPGVMNKLNQWFTKLVVDKDANRFLPADKALDQLARAGFSKDQIQKIRDAAAVACNTAIERMQSKHGDRVPAKYISKMGSSFGVFDLYLNVSEEIHKEFAALMRKLFDAKLDKMKDDLLLPKAAIGKSQEASMKGDWGTAKKHFDTYDKGTKLKEDDALQSLGKILSGKATEAPAKDEVTDSTDASISTAPVEEPALEGPVFKAGDKVKPKSGPHAGEIHTVQKVLANGSLDIVPDNVTKVKYAKGGANARPEQLELFEGFKFLGLFKKGSLLAQFSLMETKWTPKKDDVSFHNSSEEWKSGYTDYMNGQNWSFPTARLKSAEGKKYRSGWDEAEAAKKRMKEQGKVTEARSNDDFMPLSYGAKKGHTIEAYGRKGMNSLKWRKMFVSQKKLDDWVEANDAKVEGMRKLDDNEKVK